MTVNARLSSSTSLPSILSLSQTLHFGAADGSWIEWMGICPIPPILLVLYCPIYRTH